MRYLIISISMMLAFSASCASSDIENKPMAELKITESYVMLYYKDIVAPRHFYAGILGLEASFEDDWVSLYRITPTSYVGVVKESEGAWHKVQDKNAVMLSLVVDNVDMWYNKISSNQDVVILKEIYNNNNAPIRAFLIQDPGGYTVEIFQWMNDESGN
jgi:Glyoxalase/Bleomycin resistance protein/Dioxygenase superfamily